MARDDRIRMRDGLVIPGALLAFYGLLAIIYAEQFRARSDFCPDSSTILIAGICYTVWKLILPLVLLGLALVVTGLVAFRSEPEGLEGHLHHGTGAHLTLAWISSVVVLGAVAWIVQSIRQAGGEPFELTLLGERYQHTFLLELLLIVGLLVLVPYLGLYISVHVRRRRFITAATAVLTEEDEEEPLPHEMGYQYDDTLPVSEAQEQDMVPDEDWPAARDGDEGTFEEVADAPDEPEAEEEHPPEAPAAPRATSVVGCLARLDDGRSCPDTVRPGTRYCEQHGCAGTTRDGRPCGNPASPGTMYCQVHASA